jgi:hypothetical protein
MSLDKNPYCYFNKIEIEQKEQDKLWEEVKELVLKYFKHTPFACATGALKKLKEAGYKISK